MYIWISELKNFLLQLSVFVFTYPFAGDSLNIRLLFPLQYTTVTSVCECVSVLYTSNDTAPTGAVTTGFAWFGTQVAYAANESNYELLF